MKTRIKIAWRAWLAEGTAYNFCWPYLPRAMMAGYVRSYYWARLKRAMEQLPGDSGPLAQVLIELMELVG